MLMHICQIISGTASTEQPKKKNKYGINEKICNELSYVFFFRHIYYTGEGNS